MQNTRILSLTQIALCAAFIMVCSYIIIPLPFSPVPVTAKAGGGSGYCLYSAGGGTGEI